MLSIGRIGAGDGDRYLTDQVATQDAPRAGEAQFGYYERTAVEVLAQVTPWTTAGASKLTRPPECVRRRFPHQPHT